MGFLTKALLIGIGLFAGELDAHLSLNRSGRQRTTTTTNNNMAQLIINKDAKDRTSIYMWLLK